MNRLVKALLATASAAALAVGMAAPAMASNEVRITVDPLDWQWSGSITVDNFEGKKTVPFNVGPGGGPQVITNAEAPSSLAFHERIGLTVLVNPSTVTNPNTGKTDDLFDYQAYINSQFVGGLEFTRWWPHPDGYGRGLEEQTAQVKKSLAKFYDPVQDKDYYELKFYLDREAPNPPAALMNLHTVQSEGVDECDVAVTAEPGDTVKGTDGSDTVCVTVDGESDAPITVETGAGDDTVLVEGDTNAPVKVDTGAGDDVVVADTDANVVVDGGDGDNAANINGAAMTDEDLQWIIDNCTFGPYGNC